MNLFSFYIYQYSTKIGTPAPIKSDSLLSGSLDFPGFTAAQNLWQANN